MRATVGLCGLALLFWLVLFSPWTADAVNFWAGMAAATGALAGAALAADRGRLAAVYAFRLRHIPMGLGAAAVLYGVFLAGNLLARWAFRFAGPEIAGVYDTRSQAPAPVIALLLLLWIGPAEEVFWRGFVQRRLGERLGRWRGYLLASLIYAGVHVWAFNAMLFVAALVCALFWGAMFLRTRSVWPGLISHAVWDVTVFVLFPFR